MKMKDPRVVTSFIDTAHRRSLDYRPYITGNAAYCQMIMLWVP